MESEQTTQITVPQMDYKRFKELCDGTAGELGASLETSAMDGASLWGFARMLCLERDWKRFGSVVRQAGSRADAAEWLSQILDVLWVFDRNCAPEFISAICCDALTLASVLRVSKFASYFSEALRRNELKIAARLVESIKYEECARELAPELFSEANAKTITARSAALMQCGPGGLSLLRSALAFAGQEATERAAIAAVVKGRSFAESFELLRVGLQNGAVRMSVAEAFAELALKFGEWSAVPDVSSLDAAMAEDERYLELLARAVQSKQFAVARQFLRSERLCAAVAEQESKETLHILLDSRDADTAICAMTQSLIEKDDYYVFRYCCKIGFKEMVCALFVKFTDSMHAMNRARDYEGFQTTYHAGNQSLNTYLFFVFADELAEKIRERKIVLENSTDKNEPFIFHL